jgi:hypothetical protein
MDKKILAIYYTQSGQMGDIINSFTTPIVEAGATVEKMQVKPVTEYKFPWKGNHFFSVMPDCVLSVPTALQPFDLKEKAYDLVILGYQPWFLSPSIPSNSIVNHPDFKAILRDTPVITISAGRNMWLNAYDRIRKSLKEAGGKLVGNIALVDKHLNPVSFVTIFYWMLTGKKERYLNIFPKPGVSDKDISNTAVFGAIVAKHLEKGEWSNLQQELLDQKAVVVKYPLMFIEGKAKFIFAAWAKFIAKRKNKAPWISAFKYYLFVALFLGAPVLLILDAIFIKPFSTKRIKTKKQNYLQVI